MPKSKSKSKKAQANSKSRLYLALFFAGITATLLFMVAGLTFGSQLDEIISAAMPAGSNAFLLADIQLSLVPVLCAMVVGGIVAGLAGVMLSKRHPEFRSDASRNFVALTALFSGVYILLYVQLLASAVDSRNVVLVMSLNWIAAFGVGGFFIIAYLLAARSLDLRRRQ
jgi:hypothetical protein